MSKRVVRAAALGFVFLLIGVGAIAVAGGDARNFRASPLNGSQENPDVSTRARGSFTARLSSNNTRLNYTLSYQDLEGTVTQAHIHFAKPLVNGGISIWLCGTTGDNAGPAGTPTCPQSGMVSRDVIASNVVGPVGQGIKPGEFDEILAAMRAGRAYVNVHSSMAGGGEIRAQIKAVR